jgi:hypothetical protein
MDLRVTIDPGHVFSFPWFLVLPPFLAYGFW